MSKVYAVISPGYGIEAIFTTRELAEAHVEQGGGDEVEEREVLDTLPVRCTVCRVALHRTGVECRRWERDYFDHEIDAALCETGFESGQFVIGYSLGGYDVALRLAQDKLAELKAKDVAE